MNEIEWAELRWNDGDGCDYLNIYAADGVTHSYLLEDVFERMSEPTDAALRARLERVERERDEYKRLTGGKTPQEFSEWLDKVLKNTEEAAKQSSDNLAKLQHITAALEKGGGE